MSPTDLLETLARLEGPWRLFTALFVIGAAVILLDHRARR